MDLEPARAGDERAFARLVAPFRRELRAHCYRMSGSLHDADDLLQETLLRAWKGLATFEGRASLRTWLYRIATNACLDALDRQRSRTLPTEVGPQIESLAQVGPPSADPIWIGPWPDALGADSVVSPEVVYSARESVTLAFLVALQVLPAKQRAVLILRDVVGMEASECAELLDLSVAAVKSALQRARDTLRERAVGEHDPPGDADTHRELLARYVEAWESADVEQLVSLLHDDATFAMPPFAEWLRGPAAIGALVDAQIFRTRGRAGVKLVATHANGAPAFAIYFRDEISAPLAGRSIQVIEIRGDKIAGIVNFIGAAPVASFGLPPEL